MIVGFAIDSDEFLFALLRIFLKPSGCGLENLPTYSSSPAAFRLSMLMKTSFGGLDEVQSR